MFLIRVLTPITFTPGRRAISLFSTGDVHFDTTANQWAEGRMVRPKRAIAVNYREIIPQRTLRRFKIILHLHDARRSNLVGGKVADLDSHAAVEELGVDHAMGDGAVVAGDFGATCVRAFN